MIGRIAFVCLCLLTNFVELQVIKTYPKASDDEYELLHTGKVFRLRGNWTSSTALHGLDVLQNDDVADWIPETCIEAPKVGQDAGAKQLVDGFEEVAEKVGFKHEYRTQNPTRPFCLFDFRIPIRNSSRDVRLKGEFCTPERIPGGAAVADYNQDGYPDIFFTVHEGKSVLYKNTGRGTFLDVTTETNVGPTEYASGAVWADFDSDGDLDLYVTTVGGTRHHLYINQGDRFTEEALERNASGIRPDERRISGMTPNVGDYDLDGYPDLYITEWGLLKPTEDSASRLLHNLGPEKPGYFEDVTMDAGVDMDRWRRAHAEAPGTFTFCSSFTDLDEDGRPELIVTTDYGDSKIFWNLGNGSFNECTLDCGIDVRVDAMGHAIGDWNGDGHLEWFSSGIHAEEDNCGLAGCLYGNGGNALFKNLNEGRGIRLLQDVAEKVGVQEGHWGWGTTMFDFNNDKYIDFILTNGFDSPSTTQDDPFATDPMLLWVNRGPKANLTTIDQARQLGINNTKDGRGLLKFDFDSDGDEDVVVVHNVGKAALYENLAGNRNFWLRVKVMHKCPGQNSRLCDSLHARVRVTTADGWTQTQEIGSGAHFMAQNEIEAHFGLGQTGNVADVEVYWPSFNIWVKYTGVQATKRLLVVAPAQNDPKANSTLSYSKLTQCPRLKIASVSNGTKGAQVSVNYGSSSVSVLVDDPSKEQTIVFDYTVEIEPPSLASGIVSVGSVTLYVKKEPAGTAEPNCLIRHFPKSDQRRLDGASNNRNQTWWGAVAQILKRDLPPAYSDGLAGPSSQCTAKLRSANKCPYLDSYAGEGSTRPSPRFISNKLFHQAETVYSKRHLSDMMVQFSQFLTHDTDFSSPLPRFEFQTVRGDVWLPIRIPKGDVHFDPYEGGDNHLPFIRSTFNRECTGRALNVAREQINKLTSIIDGSMIYATLEGDSLKLRSRVNGKMKTQNGGFIPYNTMGLPNDNPVGRPRDQLLVAGDTRSNVQPGLIVFHSLFVREHNRQCDEYIKKRPNASDSDIFEAARRMVIAELQAITFREFLPALFGRDISPYRGYNSSVQTDIGNAFATAAFRYGHSQVNSDLWRFDKDWNVIPEGHLPLRDSYFRPERVIREGGMDPLLRGFVYQPAQEVDSLMVDDMRNVLFPVAKREGLDLAAMNIQRGRDHGLTDFNSARGHLNLKKYRRFSDISDNPNVTTVLEELYGSINNIDLWVGGLAEKKVNGSELGPLFETLVLMNFLRLRDGDYYWYERNMTAKEIDYIHSLTLSKIIQLNTDFKDVPENVFFSSRECSSVTNHQCVVRPQKECSTLSPTTDSATIKATTAAPTQTTNRPTTFVPSTSVLPTTETPTTKMPTTEMPITAMSTTDVPTSSPCCVELDNCTSAKRELNSSLAERERNYSALLQSHANLQLQLIAEKEMVDEIRRNQSSLKMSCSIVLVERDQLNETVGRQLINISRLQDQVVDVQKAADRLEQSHNSTLSQLRESQQSFSLYAKSCQKNITALRSEKQSSLSNLQTQISNLNISLINTTAALSSCRQSLTARPSSVSPTTSPSAATLSPTTTTPSPATTSSPTTEQPTTIESTTSSPCPTVDSSLLSAMQSNISRLQQNVTSMTNKVSNLQIQLEQSENSNSVLRSENSRLTNSYRFTGSKLQSCENEKRDAIAQWTACEKRTPSPTLPAQQPTSTEKNSTCQKIKEDLDMCRQSKQPCGGSEGPTTSSQPFSTTTSEEIGFRDLYNSTWGLILIALAGGFFLLWIIFFILFLVFCAKNRRSNSDDTPKKYDFTVQNRAFKLGDDAF